ncbi:gliding motility-associated C-terminal domain-containing protein [Christiangramia sabulilitoris]|uniref:Gliding motility-associated C-terminal domain-containing protein n=1 Tax=Christiangramia sabulilitoris TaxID=2583991 RepID=A0A550I416_9FLAO|nr:gliding motility-associated C-terminal domain-containing protein [Christiangramia sabulilitoris]TRO65713.1 gliding motility-associated C-terminal domain-containing protein [Christiangramia sabulilitoris]
MQNFTFGRKGHNWFLFAFILFVGNLSASYAQNCPTLSSTGDNFCYLDRVSDLNPYVSANGDGVRWYRTATSNTPIPNDEILQDGSYFAGNNSGNCSSREEFSVTVDDLGPPTSSFGNFYEPCEYSSSDVTTVGELKSLINPSSPTYDINVYGQNDEFGTNEITDDSTPLVEGNSYFIGQDDPLSSCRYSSRIAVRYNPILATAPSADANQTFCEGSTIADLEAQGINRWYSTATSNPFLDPSTPIQDGETYYASRIVNRTNSSLPPCESQDRTPVTVTIIPGPDAGEDQVGVVCLPEVEATFPDDEAVENFYLALLDSGVPTNGTFQPTINQVISAYQADSDGLGDFTTTYTIGSTDCEDSVDLTIRVIEETPANAGTFDDITDVDTNDDNIDLTALSNNDPTATPGGIFTGNGVTNNEFDPSTGAGDYTITYTVDENSAPCTTDSDSTNFTITVTEACPSPPNAGGDNIGTVCLPDVEATFPSDDETRKYFLNLLDAGVSRTGTFSPTISQLIDEYNADADGLGDFTTTYTIGSSGCNDSTNLTVRVVEVEKAEAGSFDDITNVDTDEDNIDLTSLSNNDPDATTGGTFSGTGVTNNQFDPSVGEGEYLITYTVDENSAPCTTDSDSTTFNIVVENNCPNPPNAGSSNVGIICLQDVQATFPSVDETRKYFLRLLDSGVSRNGTFNPTIRQLIEEYNRDEDGLGDFSTTYTLGTSDCKDSTILTVSVVEEEPANAGSFDNIENVCTNEDPIDLTDLTNNDSDASKGGAFSGDGVTDNSFDPSIGAGTYTITYTVDGTTPCTTGTDNTTFTIEVEDAPVSASVNRQLCISEAQSLITDFDAATVYIYSILNDAGISTIDPDGFDLADIAEGQRLVDYTNSPTTDSESFNFSYFNPSTSICNNGLINIAITISNERDAEAGTIEDQRVCESSGMIDLTEFYGENTVPGGTFSGIGVSDNMFDSSIGTNADGYEITYTVDDSANCVAAGSSDSTTFTITVDNTVTAGNSNSDEVCRANVDELFPNTTSVRNFYLNLLDNGVARNGAFNPTIQQLINDYNSNPDQDEFTTVYTISNGACNASVSLTINVFDAIPAEIDEIEDPDPICQNADDVNLFDFLADDANTNGRFEGYENGIFSPSSLDPGSYTITYVLDETSECTEGEASEDFTITVTESANAGQDKTIPEACKNSAEIDLSVYTTDGDAGGEYTFQTSGDVIVNGLLDPSTLTAGDYVIVYTVAAINDCGEDSAELALTISDAPDAPAVAGDPFSFCATDGATGADLSATGSNLTFYSDAELTMMVMAEDELVSGTYYVTQREDENGCESDATAFSVSINDAATPTIDQTTLEFCEFDDPIIADLTAQINESGTITWYDSTDGNNSLSEGTALQDGVTYYATLFNVDTGCESSVRLGVEVNIGGEECELFIPDGFSPNGDSINDTFDLKNIRNLYPNYTIEIRNRFGDVVFRGNANTPDWDGFSTEGSLGSNLVPVGAYFYYLDFRDGTTEPIRGTVYLSR